VLDDVLKRNLLNSTKSLSCDVCLGNILLEDRKRREEDKIEINLKD
jgi:hypothetical protein